jgi:hypothetical protein
VVIPVLLVMVSLLLILESGSVTDMIKDTLSLLFLNEINNYLQVRNAPEARKWKIMLKEVKLRSMTRAKSIFTLLLFIVFALLGWGASEQVYTGLWSRVHPSILFNTLRQRPFPEGQVAWALYLLTLGVVFAVFLVSKLIESGLDKLETSLADFITKEEGKEKQGLFYKYIYLPASKVQSFVAETFNPDDDIGKPVVLGVEKTKSPDGMVDALRFSTRPLPPQQATANAKKPISDSDIPKVIKSIQSGATTVEELQQTREITAEQLVLINEGISNVKG